MRFSSLAFFTPRHYMFCELRLHVYKLIEHSKNGNPSSGGKWRRWNRQVCWQNCEFDLERRKHTTTSQLLTHLLSLSYCSFCLCPPPPPFLSFPWNPFPIIKDTQMKWTLRKSGFQQGGGGRGGGGRGGWEAESWKWGIGSSRNPPVPLLLPFPPPPAGVHARERQSGSGSSTDQYHLRY